MSSLEDVKKTVQDKYIVELNKIHLSAHCTTLYINKCMKLYCKITLFPSYLKFRLNDLKGYGYQVFYWVQCVGSQACKSKQVWLKVIPCYLK